MRRNFEQIVAETAVNDHYDLVYSDLIKLMNEASKGATELFYVISKVFTFGYAMGSRATKAEARRRAA